MEKSRIHADEFSNKIVSDRKYRKLVLQRILHDCNLEDLIYGIPSPQKLNSVIRKARWSRTLREILAALLDLSDTDSISDETFHLLLHFPKGKYRNSYLSSIGHMELPFFQMCTLNQNPMSLEAFSWLFHQICKFDCFTSSDMRCILQENRYISLSAIQACIELAKEEFGESDKIAVAEKWLKNRS